MVYLKIIIYTRIILSIILFIQLSTVKYLQEVEHFFEGFLKELRSSRAWSKRISKYSFKSHWCQRPSQVISFRSAKLSGRCQCSGKEREEWIAKESQESQDLRDGTSDLPEKRDTLGFLESAHASPDLPVYNADVWTHGERKAYVSFSSTRANSSLSYSTTNAISRPFVGFFFCNVADDRRSPNRSIELIRRRLDTNT